jgi:excisionase family DNA binding protein
MKPLRTYEAAKRFNCSQRTIRRLLDQGKLPGFKIGGTWRIESGEKSENTCTNSAKSAKSATKVA